MKNNNVKNDVDAKILRIIKRESDKYFNDFFASHKDSVKTFADVKKLTGSLLDSQLDIAILDALKATKIPCVEVHISKVEERDAFRQISYVREACIKTITGEGLYGYVMALEFLKEYLK